MLGPRDLLLKEARPSSAEHQRETKQRRWVRGLGPWVLGLGFRGLGLRFWGLGFWVQGLGVAFR